MEPKNAEQMPEFNPAPDPQAHAESVDVRADYLLAEGGTDDLLAARAQAERSVSHTERVTARAKELMEADQSLSVGEAVRQAHEEAQAPQVLAAPSLAQLNAPDAATIETCTRLQAQVLVERAPGLLEAEARALALASIEKQVRASGIIDRTFGCKPFSTVTDEARRMVRARQMEPHGALLAQIYDAARDALDTAGVDFGLLVAWHRGERAA